MWSRLAIPAIGAHALASPIGTHPPLGPGRRLCLVLLENARHNGPALSLSNETLTISILVEEQEGLLEFGDLLVAKLRGGGGLGHLSMLRSERVCCEVACGLGFRTTGASVSVLQKTFSRPGLVKTQK